MNYEILSFSKKFSDQRIAQAEAILGKKTVKKILTYALFLLGVKRSTIALFLDTPSGSVRSLVLAINNRGLLSFEDQRIKTSTFKPPLPEKIEPTIELDKSFLQVNFNVANIFLRIPNSNTFQKRVVLLSMSNSGLLKRNEVANALGLSLDRTKKLAKNLEQEDIKSIIDQRKGQTQDYRFTPEIKGQLIKQFVIEAVSQHPTGASAVLLSNISIFRIAELTGSTVINIGDPLEKISSLAYITCTVSPSVRDTVFGNDEPISFNI